METLAPRNLMGTRRGVLFFIDPLGSNGKSVLMKHRYVYFGNITDALGFDTNSISRTLWDFTPNLKKLVNPLGFDTYFYLFVFEKTDSRSMLNGKRKEGGYSCGVRCVSSLSIS